MSGLELPFILPQGADPEQQQLEVAPPFNFGEPIIQAQQDGRAAIISLNKAAYYPTVADQENNTRYLIDVEEHYQLVEEARQQGLFEPQNLSANYTMNGTETIISSGIILDVSGFDALAEFEEEVSAAIATNATESNATTTATTEASTTPVPPVEIGQGNTTTTTVPEQEEEDFPALPYPMLNSFTLTFEEPGRYEYFCAFHPAMWGVVTVVGQE
jgi:hypothetical protein